MSNFNHCRYVMKLGRYLFIFFSFIESIPFIKCTKKNPKVFVSTVGLLEKTMGKHSLGGKKRGVFKTFEVRMVSYAIM